MLSQIWVQARRRRSSLVDLLQLESRGIATVDAKPSRRRGAAAMVAARLRHPRHGERAWSQKGCTGARSWANPMGIRFVAPAPSQTPTPCAQDRETRKWREGGAQPRAVETRFRSRARIRSTKSWLVVSDRGSARPARRQRRGDRFPRRSATASTASGRLRSWRRDGPPRARTGRRNRSRRQNRRRSGQRRRSAMASTRVPFEAGSLSE